MTEIGDRWREFALFGVRNCKGRALEGNTYPAMADILHDCANQEDALFRNLADLIS